MLFQHQKALADSDLVRYASTLGLDQSKFTECLARGSSSALNGDIDTGKDLGVKGTPAFFIGTKQSDGAVVLTRRIDGAVPLETLEAALDQVKEKSRRRWWFMSWTAVLPSLGASRIALP